MLIKEVSTSSPTTSLDTQGLPEVPQITESNMPSGASFVALEGVGGDLGVGKPLGSDSGERDQADDDSLPKSLQSMDSGLLQGHEGELPEIGDFYVNQPQPSSSSEDDGHFRGFGKELFNPSASQKLLTESSHQQYGGSLGQGGFTGVSDASPSNFDLSSLGIPVQQWPTGFGLEQLPAESPEYDNQSYLEIGKNAMVEELLEREYVESINRVDEEIKNQQVMLENYQVMLRKKQEQKYVLQQRLGALRKLKNPESLPEAGRKLLVSKGRRRVEFHPYPLNGVDHARLGRYTGATLQKHYPPSTSMWEPSHSKEVSGTSWNNVQNTLTTQSVDGSSAGEWGERR